jgi:serine/threonine protein kinase
MIYNSRVPCKTSVHFGEYHLVNRRDKNIHGTFTDFDSELLGSGFDESKYDLVQVRLHASDFLNKSVRFISQEIGKGSFGTALRCIFRGKEYVVKIPNTLWESDTLYPDGEGFLAFQNPYGHFDAYRSEALPGFVRECTFNEGAVDSITHRNKRENVAGVPLPSLNSSEYLDIMREMNLMKSHEGYDHIHKILGFVAELPILFSERCDGSLSSLLVGGSDRHLFDVVGGRLSPQWIKLAKQIGSAIEYLDIFASIAHMDIKPANILYIESSGANGLPEFNWKLSDFGICVNKTVRGDYTTPYVGGTDWYMPAEVNENRRISGYTFDAYACSIYSYMISMIECIKFEISGRNQFLMERRRQYFTAGMGDNISDFIKNDNAIWDIFNDYDSSLAVNDDAFGSICRMYFCHLAEIAGIFNELMIRLRLRV